MGHNTLSAGQIHIIYDVEYSTRTAMLSVTSTLNDVGKIWRVTDEDAYYIVKTSGSPGTFLNGAGEEVAKTSTTDATNTVVYTYTMADNSAIVLKCNLLGMKTDGSDRAVYEIKALFYRDGGNATKEGSTINVITPIKSDATWGAMEFSVSGNDVRVRIIGKAATNITWISETKLTHVI